MWPEPHVARLLVCCVLVGHCLNAFSSSMAFRANIVRHGMLVLVDTAWKNASILVSREFRRWQLNIRLTSTTDRGQTWIGRKSLSFWYFSLNMDICHFRAISSALVMATIRATFLLTASYMARNTCSPRCPMLVIMRAILIAIMTEPP